MAMPPVLRSMSATIRRIATGTGEFANYSPGQDKRLFCVLNPAMPCLCGASSKTTADKKALTAPYFGMKADFSHRSLSDKLMWSLTSLGLVSGITPTSARKPSDQETLDFVSWQPAGVSAVTRRAVCSFLNATFLAATPPSSQP